MTCKNNPNYISYIDLIRFFAASIVVLYHVGFFYCLPGQALAELMHETISPHAVFNFGWIGVEIFFVISGFVISYSAARGNASRFALSRFLRLAPTAWICASFSLIIYIFLHQAPIMHLMTAYAATIIFWPFRAIDGVYWTLGVEVSFYALIFVLLKTNRLASLEKIMLGIGLVSLAFWTVFLTLEMVLPHIHMYSAEKALLWTHKIIAARILQLFLVQHGCFFALGVYIRTCVNRGLPGRQTIAIIALIAACVMEIIGQADLLSRITSTHVGWFIPTVIWSLACAAIVWASRQAGANVMPACITRAVRFSGCLTYPLYLFHTAAILLSISVLTPIMGTYAIFSSVCVAFLTAAAIHVYAEPLLHNSVKTALTSHTEKNFIFYLKHRMSEFAEVFPVLNAMLRNEKKKQSRQQ
ncbi:acyltransferase family protein [Acetobacter fallax]|uniref:Acyltransferase family protein n=1 Tax=Acetobacter fallax TaxID=1737473 RepID=A0ABX0KEP7_9PROT|nr:acyltransferase [Acetobacter fallax]NHO33959.1 acyltransferase family protein [Acetobacter fallax]NHO37494.1 acyltransferase family protein [Acetobacter fallax]